MTTTPSNVAFQFASDIHLEFEPLPVNFDAILKPCPNSVLILAGDIGIPTQPVFEEFLVWCVKRWPLGVLLISGNHEYYGSSVEVMDKLLKEMCSRTGARYLLNGTYRIGNETIVLGTTLWSLIPNERLSQVKSSLNDYNLIAEFKTNASVAQALHAHQREWLRKTLEECKKFKTQQNKNLTIVIATHHAPLVFGTSNPKYNGDPIACAFASDCSDMMADVDLWIFGHTHYNNSQIHPTHRTLVTCNQRGYRGECPSYDPARTWSKSMTSLGTNATYATPVTPLSAQQQQQLLQTQVKQQQQQPTQPQLNQQQPMQTNQQQSGISTPIQKAPSINQTAIAHGTPAKAEITPTQELGLAFVQWWFAHFPSNISDLREVLLDKCVVTTGFVNLTGKDEIVSKLSECFSQMKLLGTIDTQGVKTKVDLDKTVFISGIVGKLQTTKANGTITHTVFSQTFRLVPANKRYWLLHSSLVIHS